MLPLSLRRCRAILQRTRQAQVLFVSLLALNACGLATQNGDSSASASGGQSGSGGVTSTGGTAGTAGTGGAGATGGSGGGVIGTGGITVTSCATEAQDQQFFPGQSFNHQLPVARVLYSWTTATQEAELRADPTLLTTGEAPGLGRGLAMDTVQSLADGGDVLAKGLMTVFTKYRYAWTNPWATRMGWPGETYGDRLIRIVLKAEAWIAVLHNGELSGAYDQAGNVIDRDLVVASPERVGALFFVNDSAVGGPICGTYTGTFAQGSNGYRELVVGNESMIEEWSLGTQSILDRINDDIAELERFADFARTCPMAWGEFNVTVACGWDSTYYDDIPPSYADALALPSPYYEPTPENLDAIVTTLRADPFAVDPLVVTPGGP
jgi:hypothetical protein